MTTTRPRMRMSFRTRLGLIITVVFIAAGAGLLAVQYLVVQQLFASAIDVTAVSCAQLAAPLGETQPEVLIDSTGCAASYTASVPAELITETSPALVSVTGAVIQQSRFLSDEVVGGLLLWSIVTLVAFAAVAAAIAFWLARRSLDRIGEVTSAARDISERDLGRRLDLPGPHDEIKELGDTFDGMLDRLQLAFTAQDRFVANASHELRTPLTTTRIALEIPLEHGDVPKKLQPALRRALKATEQSERLISALLALSRARGELDELETVDLGALVEAELAELSHEGIAVTSDISPGPVSADPTLLARAVRNLLDNGVRHNIEGGSLHVSAHGSTLVVESSGAVLDPATVALLTEPFFRGEATRTSAGESIGLGLAIVESIALTHGGTLALAPREGGGLIATLALPVP
jgi:signal transduction histidine kinase